MMDEKDFARFVEDESSTEIRRGLWTLYGITRDCSSERGGIRVLEIGVRAGNSTIAFLAALSHARGQGLVSLDDNSDELRGLPIAFERVRRWGFQGLWKFHRAKSLQWRQTDSPFDLIFLDGDHAYDTVRAELKRYLPLLTPNGLVLLHDLDLDGPAQAFREIAADPHYRAAALGYGGGLGMVSRG